MLLLERGTLGGGTSAQSSCIVRTHYPLPPNVALAQAALAIFRDFPNYLDDPEADCGLNACGLMLIAPDGERADGACARRSRCSVARGVRRAEIAPTTRGAFIRCSTSATIPVIGWEPAAGYADAYLTLSAYARARGRLGRDVARRRRRHRPRRDGARVTGVETTRGPIGAGLVVSAQNMWSRELARWTGIDVPLTLSRHAVMTLESATRLSPTGCRS